MLTPLRLARLKKGLRQIDISLKLGGSTAQISHFEAGILQPPDDIKKQLSELLDCPMSELFPELSVGKDDGVQDKDHNPSLSSVAGDKCTAGLSLMADVNPSEGADD